MKFQFMQTFPIKVPGNLWEPYIPADLKGLSAVLKTTFFYITLHRTLRPFLNCLVYQTNSWVSFFQIISEK